MPPETPTRTVRPRSTAGLRRLRRGSVLVEVRDLHADDALEGGGRHLARDVLAGAVRPVVEAARLARGHDAQLVLVGALRRDEGSELGHEGMLLVGVSGVRAPGADASRARARRPRWRSGG